MQTQIHAGIITIGDEILVGQTIDTNSAWLATKLNEIGISVREILSISDKADRITEALDRMLTNCSLVIFTGGLGPTKDDITKHVLTHYFDDTLILNATILKRVEEMFRHLNRPMLDVNKQQAMLPSKAIIIENDLGTASGMWFTKDGADVISLPGVPFEMKGLMEKIIPEFQKKYKLATFYHRTILFQGIGESQLAHEINDIEEACAKSEIAIAYLPSPGIVKLRLTGTKEQSGIMEQHFSLMQKRFEGQVFGFDDDTLEKVIGKHLSSSNQTLSTVESCTGGTLASRIVSVPGSSSYYLGSIIAYDNAVKSSLADVQPEIISTHGAVSQQVAEQMALGGAKRLNSHYCIATTGIAGPDGGTAEKPVGTVWIAIASPEKVYSKQFLFKHNRERNIELTVVYALNFLRRIICKTND
ncbi:MAG: competence/damage-inducible protein A [Crocinitomicaceae bacterium]|nr:competence/damage-inducible protein A [Crocinitomicaceae bacterium]MBK8926063.1 competence/damage-inducible protein A [Crocinitomicaceae bacterium]